MTFSKMPARLLKFYDDPQFAEEFAIRGRIRLTLADEFRRTEDASRVDKTEGEVKFKISNQHLAQVSVQTGEVVGHRVGELDYGLRNLTPIFLFCTSLPSVDMSKLHSKWKCAVEIVNPSEFFTDLTEALNNHPVVKPQLGLEHGAALYNKGSIGQAPEIDVASRLAIFQKPPEYEFEQEYRFAAKCLLEGLPENLVHLDVQLKRFRNYTQILNGVSGRGDR